MKLNLSIRQKTAHKQNGCQADGGEGNETDNRRNDKLRYRIGDAAESFAERS